jgi:hypothetical protein
MFSPAVSVRGVWGLDCSLAVQCNCHTRTRQVLITRLTIQSTHNALPHELPGISSSLRELGVEQTVAGFCERDPQRSAFKTLHPAGSLK